MDALFSKRTGSPLCGRRLMQRAALVMLSVQLLLAASHLFAAPALAQVATAIDGDTLKIDSAIASSSGATGRQ